MRIDFANVKFDEKGLIPAIVQDVKTNAVLMLAYMNEESLARTVESGYTWFGAAVARNYGIRALLLVICRKS